MHKNALYRTGKDGNACDKFGQWMELQNRSLVKLVVVMVIYYCYPFLFKMCNIFQTVIFLALVDLCGEWSNSVESTTFTKK